MYCRQCGKFINYDADICNECKQKEQQNAANTGVPTQPVYFVQSTSQPIKPVEEGSVTTGLGKAIASAIMAEIGFIFAYIAIIALGLESSYGGNYGSAILMFVFALGLSIPALILGIQSIKTFSAEKNAGRKKPIPTLIIGIVGLATAALSLLFCFIIMMGLMVGV